MRRCRGDEKTTGDLSWAKWGYWELHAILFLAVYTAILVLPHTRWRVRPAQCRLLHPCLSEHAQEGARHR